MLHARSLNLPLSDEDVIKRAKARVAQMKGEGETSVTHHSRDILGLLQIPQDKDKAWSRPTGQTVYPFFFIF